MPLMACKMNLAWALVLRMLRDWDAAAQPRANWQSPELLEIYPAACLCLRLGGLDPMQDALSVDGLVDVRLLRAGAREHLHPKAPRLTSLDRIKRVCKPKSTRSIWEIGFGAELSRLTIEIDLGPQTPAVQVVDHQDDGFTRGQVTYLITSDLQHVLHPVTQEVAQLRQHDHAAVGGGEHEVGEERRAVAADQFGLSASPPAVVNEPASCGDQCGNPSGINTGIHGHDFDPARAPVKQATEVDGRFRRYQLRSLLHALRGGSAHRKAE